MKISDNRKVLRATGFRSKYFERIFVVKEKSYIYLA